MYNQINVAILLLSGRSKLSMASCSNLNLRTVWLEQTVRTGSFGVIREEKGFDGLF